MAVVKFTNVQKIYDKKVQAVYDFNLEVADKEFVALVGPSGCGKSTTLRMLAGLEEITDGTIEIDGEVVNDMLPKDRDIAMVFQSYALYPHMTVYDNMAFALKIRKYPKSVIKERVEHAAEILGLTDYLKRKPKALSGGQRQRVALGRAIVRTPKVFLMDEPLSNLDAKLRVAMRSEITRIHRSVNATTVYVTHDQTEAMTMADRIVVMKDGFIQQIGTPKEIYNKPSNMFVASFIGSPAMNFIVGKVEKENVNVYDGDNVVLSIKLDKDQNEALKEYQGKEITLGIRPENISVNSSNDNDKNDVFSACTEIVELLGSELIIYTKLAGKNVVIKLDNSHDIKNGDIVNYCVNAKAIHFFDSETTNRIS